MEQPALVIALVGALGIGAQWVAWRTGWPAIVLMLAAGFLAGPVLNLFDPRSAFGPLLSPMVSIGVALILFEGGLSLNFREFREYGQGVRRLVLLGAPVGWLLNALAIYYIAGLVWPVAIIFGGLLVVTGPTVVQPLLRQSTIAPRPAAILRWEAIVNDPLGALCAVVAYEYFRLTTDDASLLAVLPPMFVAALAAGAIGYAAARLIAWAFPRGFVPEFLKVPVLLAAVIAVFVGSNLIEHEAGLMAVTVMGIALANLEVSSLRSIHPFKQNVSLILVSGIFVVLSASLDVESLRMFEWRFGLFLLALLFLLRPATVLISLAFSDIPWNERLFLAWIAPRGIVMVAVSGLFALRLEELGYGDGLILISLSFGVVVATVIAHGFTIQPAARLLGVKRDDKPGLLIVGATRWTVALARQLHALEVPVMVADTSWERLAPMRAHGLRSYHGEILNEATEGDLDLSTFQALIAATENEAYNTLVCTEFAPIIGRDAVYQLGDEREGEEHRRLPEGLRGRTLFESGWGVEEVAERLSEGWGFHATRLTDALPLDDVRDALPEEGQMLLLVRAKGRLRFFTHASQPTPGAGDTIVWFAPPEAMPEDIAATPAATDRGMQTA